MTFPISCLSRYFDALLLLCCITGSLIYTFNQYRFQGFLSSQQITFEHFPAVYAEKLRSKDWKSLERNQFDYARHFHANGSRSSSDTIPPKIHFIWFKDLYTSHLDISKLPSLGSRAPSLCQKHNSLYAIKVWNQTEGRKLLEEHYSWFLPTYDSYRHPIQRIDALKYFILWHYGGVYMDMDISCRRPLEPLLDFPAWFPEALPLGLNNDLMAARPGHPVLALMLENLAKRNRNLIFPYLTIFWSTGPQFTSDMLKKWFLTHGSRPKGNITGADDWFVLPNQFYSEEYTFFGHSPGGTWHGDDVAVVLWLVKHPSVSCLLAIAALSSCLAPVLWRRRKSRERLQRSRDGAFKA